MYIHIYVYIYICMHIHIYVYMYTCVYMYVYTWIDHIYTYLNISIHTCTSLHIICVNTYKLIQFDMYICTRVDTRICTQHIHIYISATTYKSLLHEPRTPTRS